MASTKQPKTPAPNRKPAAKPKAAAKRKHTTKAKTGTRSARKLDRAKAYDYYFADHTRSYNDVAKKFGVSKQAVEAIAKVTVKDDKGTSWVTWAEHRLNLAEEAQKKRDAEYRKSAPARSEQHLLQYRNLQVAAGQKVTSLAQEGKWMLDIDSGKKIKIQEVDARQLADVAKALKLAIDGERVIMGLPTSVATIKPGSDDETGKGWGELLALAMREAAKDTE